MINRHFALAASFLLAFGGNIAGSATITWTNVAGGNWNVAANWNPNSVPGAGDTAVITNSSTTVTLNVSPTVGGITLGANAGCGGGTILLLNGQTLTLRGPLAVGSCGQLTVDSGTLSGATAGAILSGVIGWTGGILSGTLTLAATGTLNIAGGAGFNDLPNCTFTNNGTVIWTGGHIRGSGNTTVFNLGLWDCQSDLPFDNNTYGGTINLINLAAGTFRKSAGTNTTTLGPGLFLSNSGTLDVRTNYLSLNGGGNLTGGSVTGVSGILQLAAGAYTINGTTTTTNVQLAGGTLAGTSVINGGFTWVAGSWNGAVVTVAGGGLLNILGGTNFNDLPNCTLTNNGTVTWNSGHVRGGNNGTAIFNAGLWDCRADLIFDNSTYGGTVNFNNLGAGTLRKSAGTNVTILGAGVFLSNSGILDVLTNYLSLNGGGSFTGGSVTSTPGVIQLAAGSYTINGTVTTTNVQMTGGALAGVNIINGGFTWVAGDWNGAVVTVTGSGLLNILGDTGVNDLPNCTVTNNGTVTWNSGHIRGGDGVTTIYNSGLWDCRADFLFDNGSYGGTINFVNLGSGTFRKSMGIGTTTLGAGVIFNHSGTLDVQSNYLSLNGGGNFTNGSVTSTPGVIQLAAGNFTVNGTITTTNVQLAGGTLAGVNVIRGGFTWVAGSWNSTVVTVASNSLLNIQGGAGVNDLPNCTLTNSGTVAWSSGHIRGGGGTTSINNLGLWDCQSDQTFDNSSYGGNVNFINSGTGTLRKSAGTGVTLLASGLFLGNSGTLDSQTGTLSLLGSYSLTNGTLNFGISSLAGFGKINLAGAATLSGTVAANLNNGYVPVSGNSFAVLAYGSATGLFTNTILPFAAAWKTNYAATAFSLQVSNSRPQFAAAATQFVNELTTLRVTNLATDLDLPAQTVTNNLVSAPISGMTFNTSSGVITWTPAQNQSPSTNTISTSATDNGVPPLSATNTFTVIVREVNVAPTLPTISPTNVNALAGLTVSNRATEINIHSTNSGYTLINPPAGIVISTNGVITWTPNPSQGHATNIITTVVTNFNPYDLINPNLTATNNFTVIVFAPAFAPIGNFTVNVGQTVSFTASATDNDSTRSLAYSLGTAPATATINPASGLFNWRPPVTSAGISNGVQALVTANSTPPFTATQSFFVKVNALTPVTLVPITNTRTQFRLQIAGPVGPDYILETTNSLAKASWANLLTNTPTVLPFNVTDTLVNTFTDRYYRVRLGP